MVNYNGGRIFLRDVKTSGYKRALADLDTPDWAAALPHHRRGQAGQPAGRTSRSIVPQPATSAFPSPSESLRLPVKETPLTAWEDPAKWAVVDAFGADPSGEADSAAAIQKAMDSGATTVFFPGNYQTTRTIVVRGKVRRVVGIGGG